MCCRARAPGLHSSHRMHLAAFAPPCHRTHMDDSDNDVAFLIVAEQTYSIYVEPKNLTVHSMRWCDYVSDCRACAFWYLDAPRLSALGFGMLMFARIESWTYVLLTFTRLILWRLPVFTSGPAAFSRKANRFMNQTIKQSFKKQNSIEEWESNARINNRLLWTTWVNKKQST